MIINNAPQNEAVLSNVGEIGEFRIRNSAKAFNILSSGLYANKIRAIVRELSCNAVDSHTAAGKADTPFDVHLPNSLEPWFSIRDYGTGLNHDQVTNIYTTYFESTKTNSNDFIGALGLGSKSPFSYTDNFTVTAIKDGVKGIYTAFINEAGVPSIAKMMEEATDEPAGVEVKFSVNERYDFDKFRQEARNVYKYFSLRPVISGNADFKFETAEYESQDVIPGVHQYKDAYRRQCVAVMGNIAYPIDIPQADKALGDLYRLLSCGLEMHFAIGELDFQASREGLSYIPQTVEAIKRKLEAVNAVLTTKLAAEADAIPNLWDRAIFLAKRKDNHLWTNAVVKYATDTELPTFDNSRYGGLANFKITLEDLANTYNIQVRGFNYSKHNKAYPNLKHDSQYSDTRNAAGHYDVTYLWSFPVSDTTHFVINDTKIGAVERAKYHYRATQVAGNAHVYVLEPVDKNKAMDTDAFFKAIHSPRTEKIVNASTMLKKERAAGVAKNVTILKLERRNNGGYHREREMVWRDAGKADSFDSKETYYYMPLSGFQMLSTKGYTSGKEFFEDITALPGLFNGEVYGVRKGDLDYIKTQKNWINIETHIEQVLNGKDVSKVLLSIVRGRLDRNDILNFKSWNLLPQIDEKSPFAQFVNVFKNVDAFSGSSYNVSNLFHKFAPNANISPDALVVKYQQQLDEVNRRYPLLTKLNTYRVDASDIAEYVNLIDQKKGI